MRTIRQCCNNECNNNAYCEEEAWKHYKKQRTEFYKRILSSPVVIYWIPFIIGFIVGKLT